MSYLVLARKWRPMRFEDLVGQDHVARTLGNAIKSGRVAHAFLFTGVRGVGKTTSARILAKALNCMGDPASTPPGTDPGPTTSPCLKCPACLEIAQGNDIDVREIDGASYNGVDEVRKLQDSIPYRPNRDRFKIFIVDEVHMLSQSAWNAFLKTLEEPPPHVKFIFATTEVQKVPVTILSRVQRFDFKMIPTQVIAARLAHVLSVEGIQADEAAISIVAREAAGSMRDAMSLLDQVIAWGGEVLKGDDVARVLGVASHAVLYELAGALIGADAQRCLRIIADLADQGYDISHVAKDTLTLLRNLVVSRVCAEPGTLLDLPDEEARDVRQLAASADTDDLLRLHQGFATGFDEVVKSGQPRAALEMMLVRLSRRPPLVPLDALVGRLAQLERRLLGGGGGGRPAAAARPPSAPAPEPAGSGARPRDARPARESKPESSDDRGEPPPASYDAEIEFDEPPSVPASTPLASSPSPPSARPSSAPVSAPPSARLSSPPASSPPLSSVPPSGPPSGIPPHSRPPARPDPRFQRPEAVVDLDELLRSIVGRVASERPELAAKLEHAVPLELASGQLVLGWAPGSVFGSLVAGAENATPLERAASAVLGKPTRVVHEQDSVRAAGRKTLSRLEAEERERKVREAYDRAKRHPRIAEAVEILGAKLRDLKLAKLP